jgi:hypothetical protein
MPGLNRAGIPGSLYSHRPRMTATTFGCSAPENISFKFTLRCWRSGKFIARS